MGKKRDNLMETFGKLNPAKKVNGLYFREGRNR
jgi:hypothetical protein